MYLSALGIEMGLHLSDFPRELGDLASFLPTPTALTQSPDVSLSTELNMWAQAQQVPGPCDDASCDRFVYLAKQTS